MKSTTIEPHKSSLGLEANVLALITYAAMAALMWASYLGWVAWAIPLVIFFLEKSSKFVKFHAVQALVFGIVDVAIRIVFKILVWIFTPKTVVGALNALTGSGTAVVLSLLGIVSAIVGIAFLALYAFTLYKAFKYQQVELPIVGPIAAKASAKLETININIPSPGQQAPVAVRCPGCGVENPSGTKFCGACGYQLF